MISFGPKKIGCNLLINRVPDYEKRPSIWPKWATREAKSEEDDFNDEDDEEEDDDHIRDNDHSIISGFQLATNCGPICNEPLMGVAVILIDWRREKRDSSPNEGITEGTIPDVVSPSDSSVISHGPMSGQLMSAMKEGILKSFNQHPRRLMVAMYSCEIQVISFMCDLSSCSNLICILPYVPVML